MLPTTPSPTYARFMSNPSMPPTASLKPNNNASLNKMAFGTTKVFHDGSHVTYELNKGGGQPPQCTITNVEASNPDHALWFTEKVAQMNGVPEISATRVPEDLQQAYTQRGYTPVEGSQDTFTKNLQECKESE